MKKAVAAPGVESGNRLFFELVRQMCAKSRNV